jgi:hypothetical protein
MEEERRSFVFDRSRQMLVLLGFRVALARGGLALLGKAYLEGTAVHRSLEATNNKVGDHRSS